MGSTLGRLRGMIGVMFISVGVWYLGLPSLAKAVPPGPPETVPVEVKNDASNAVPVTITESNEVPVTIMESADSRVVLHFRFDTNDVCGPQSTGQGIFHAEVPGASPLVDPVPFVVPADKTLLITHVSWTAFGGQSDQWIPGEFLRIIIGRNTGEFRVNTGTPITSELAAARIFTGNLNIEGGVPFRAGENVCIVGGTRVGSQGGSSDSPSLNGTIAHGRLVDN